MFRERCRTWLVCILALGLRMTLKGNGHRFGGAQLPLFNQEGVSG